jgi:MATE family multidrug resistance protein
VNAILAYLLIFGHAGLPALGIAGAGWATVAGTTTSAILALILFFRRKYRAEFATWNWRFEPALFRRMMRFGFPNGLQWMLDALAFTFFLFLVGRLGDVELAATNITFAINMVGLLPMLGMGQAVGILVGQNLGKNRPDLAARSTWNGAWLASLYIGSMAILYVVIPRAFFYFFESPQDPHAEAVAELVPTLLCYAAVYSIFDVLNIVFSFALRGAGDTRFVTLVALSFAWPCMVFPTWAAWKYGWKHSLYWAWGFASFYIIAEGLVFLGRFLTGKWKTMRVIEAAPTQNEQPIREIETDEAMIVPTPDLTGEAVS